MFIQYDSQNDCRFKNHIEINLNVIDTIQYCSQKLLVHIIPSI